MSKTKRFSMDRLVEEFWWMARKRLPLIYSCDSNYGMFDRDVELTRQMIKVKEKTGYPQKFRASYAKNSSERVFAITKMLNDAGMNKGATLSMQSLDENTLAVVKRKNIKLESFRELMIRYHREGVATYSELIVGLPGESYESFAKGIDTLVEAGVGNSIHVYCCGVFPNSEMSDPGYQQRHEIKTVLSPVTIYHGQPDQDSRYQEFDLLVTSTKTLPPEDWLKCWQLAHIIMAFHCMGLTQAVAVFCRKNRNVSHRRFYEGLLNFANRPLYKTLLAEVAAEATQHFKNLADGKPWGIVDKRFGNVLWPVEEGSFLKLATEHGQVYRELRHYLNELLDDPGLVGDLIEYQKAVFIDPHRLAGKYRFKVGSNLHEYIQGVYLGQDVAWLQGEFEYEVTVEKGYGENLEEYAREICWFGRKGGSFQHKNVKRVEQ